MRLCGCRAARVEVNKVIKGWMQIAGTFKGKGAAYSERIRMVFVVMTKIVSKCSLGSLSMLKLVHWFDQ